MPIGFTDLLQTNAQLINGLTKGIVSTDDTFGGVRSKIDDWTDLHLSTRTTLSGGTYKTFKDSGTGTSPGQFKAFSTIYYVADGRPLVQTPSAAGAIRLNSSGEFTTSGGAFYTHDDTGAAEPAYYVLTDATQIDGTELLPKFTITGSQGSGSSTAFPAGYQKFSTVNNTVGVSLATSLNDNLLSETGGELALDNQNANTIFAGPIDGSAAVPAFRALDLADITNNLVTLGKLQTIAGDTILGRESGAAQGNVQQLNANDVLAILGVEAGAQENAPTNLGQNTAAGSLTVTSSTGSNVSLQAASSTLAGIVLNGDQTFGGNKTFEDNVSIGGNLTVSGNFVQANGVTVDFEDAVLALGVPRDSNNDIEDAVSSTDTGLNFVKVTDNGAITEFAALRYDVGQDKFKFIRHADGDSNTVTPYGEVALNAGADNVKALKFETNVTNLGVDSADVADIYGTNPSAVSNDTQIRSLGAVAKCRITITTEATDTDNNFAPVSGAAAGYPIKHGLGTESIFVVAIKDPLGTPIPIFCKYEPKNANVAVVSVGITAENEVYDIIVIG